MPEAADKGQRYEIRFKDRTTFEDRILGWADTEAEAQTLYESTSLMPTAINSYVIDRQEGPVCTGCGGRMSDPRCRWRHCPACDIWVDSISNKVVSKPVVHALHRFLAEFKRRNVLRREKTS